jgi:sorbitol-specific phosphotransferase system component IIBC
MSAELLNFIKEQISALTVQEKAQLADYLIKENSQHPQAQDYDQTDEIRRKRMEWIKTHRDEYDGRYVAFYGDVLVGVGLTIREAREEAISKGIDNPFLVRITSEQTTLSAGW